MTGDPLQTFRTGDSLGSLRADTANAWTAAAKAHRSTMRKTGGPSGGPVGNPGSLEVLIRNDTGGTLAERSVLAVGDPLLDATIYGIDLQARPAFAGDAPAGTDDVVVITTEPLPDGEIGRAVLAGVAVVTLSVVDAAHGYCGPTAAQTGYLTTDETGPIRILWKESGTGSKLGIVLLQETASPLQTANVDGTEESYTRRLEFDQDTYIAVTAGATDADPDTVALDVAGLAGELGLTTGNTADSGAEDSTTTLLRFADPTGIRVDAGATAGDADVVSLTFGQSITFVECVSLTTTSSGGNITSVTLTTKKRTLTISDGATIGPALCAENPADCCDPGVVFDGCSHVYPTTIYFTFTSTGGDCGCFTGTVTLTWDATDNRWEGTFSGCTGTVTFTLTVDDFAAPASWTMTVAGASYTFTLATTKSFVCNDLPTGVKFNAEGACTGFFIGDFSE